MTYNRRELLSLFGRMGLTATTAPLWSSLTSLEAMAQNSASSYKAIVVVSLTGGNDANNMVVPLDGARYRQYASLRPTIAIPSGSCLPLHSSSGGQQYGLHPAMPKTAALYNSGRALIVANVGPKDTPLGKAAMQGAPELTPQSMFDHPAGLNQWESATNEALPSTGWGGRMADLLISQSGSLPPVLNAATSSTFTCGRSVQGIAVRAGAAVATAYDLPPVLGDTVMALAAIDSRSGNQLVAESAAVRASALRQQALLEQAQSSGTPLTTAFPQTGLGQELRTVANVLKGTRNVIGASRQIFYAQHGPFDTHGDQLQQHSERLSELDTALAAFVGALDEMGLGNQVLVCTLSDFNRTMLENTSGGTDHAWGSHQLILGGGISGGRILGTFPDLDLGGSADWGSTGIWVPSTSVTEMAAGVGAWMGLSTSQLQSVFPALSRFPGGALSLN